MVSFKHEEPQKKGRTVDLGVHGTGESTIIGAHDYSIYEPFMVIEAKRLPAPSKDREREYVVGTDSASGTATGGIQRFKLGLHGDQIETAVMVGYLEKLSAHHWHVTINRWITDLAAVTSQDDCVWCQSDALQQLACDNEQDTATTMSFHQRVDGCVTNAIRIHHLWIIMSGGHT